MTEQAAILWEPSQQRIKQSNLTAFAQRFQANALPVDYESLWQWSTDHPNEFWPAVAQFTDLIAEGDLEPGIIAGRKMLDAEWFPATRLNYAENLLRDRPLDEEVVVFQSEDKASDRLDYKTLYDQVSVVAQALANAGVGEGDRVAAVMPNCPQTLIAMLATTSLGAIWSSCSPDFGVEGIVDRFAQIEPTVLFLVQAYYYNGKKIDLSANNQRLSERLSPKNIVVSSFTGDSSGDYGDVARITTWDRFTEGLAPETITFRRVAFNHPLFIMYSSGTTSKPKCIVHGHGGTLLQHLKEHQLHADIKPGDRLFYYTTCGWMMWNWLVSGLASRATLLLYDGSPFAPNSNVLFDYIDREKITHFGVSAKFIDACQKEGLNPASSHDLGSLQTILSTGSVLGPASFDYVYAQVKQDLCLSSISGGTDILGCFALGNPWLPVYRGELQCRGLGMDVSVYDDNGHPVVGSKGELVCRRPFPSQPLGFWGDTSGEKYFKAYFSRFENIWCQGDYVELTERNTMVFYGRSDAVLNPGGVRIGTAEIYRQVETIPDVLESIAIGQEWDNDVRVVLFVRLRDDLKLDDQLITLIKTTIRRNASPRHMPAKVIQVPDIPRTMSGKLVELAVKKVIHGEPVTNRDAFANPESLEFYKNIPELQ